MIERVALYCTLLALASVLGADLLSSMLQKGELPAIAFVHPDRRPTAGPQDFRNVGVDMTATGSIPSAASAARAAAPVSPCDNGRK